MNQIGFSYEIELNTLTKDYLNLKAEHQKLKQRLVKRKSVERIKLEKKTERAPSRRHKVDEPTPLQNYISTRMIVEKSLRDAIAEQTKIIDSLRLEKIQDQTQIKELKTKLETKTNELLSATTKYAGAPVLPRGATCAVTSMHSGGNARAL